MERVGLVLEGGGMRGVYTAGVLECFLDAGLRFPYVIGVSAGACQASSYLSGQKGRNRRITVELANHPQYVSVWNLFRERSLFGMNLLFDEIPNRLDPFDFDAFFRDPGQFWVVATDAVTGEPFYKEKGQTASGEELLTVVRASSSLPFISPPVRYEGRTLFDGGLSDPIPIRKSMADGNERHVVVLTKEMGYRRKPFRHRRLAGRFYPEYPGLVRAMEQRHQVYNDTLDLLEQLQAEGKAIIIQPESDLGVGRMTRDRRKLSALYEQGYRDAERALDRIRA